MIAGSPARPRIVVLTTGSPLAKIVVNGLVSRLGPVTVIEEIPEDKATIIRRRLRREGPLAVVGQLAFGFALRAIFTRHRRHRQIWAEHGLNPFADPMLEVHCVASVNDPECRRLLRKFAPEVVAVYGTRVLSAETLGCSPAPFINYHAGITPMYRGQHPAYWALNSGDAKTAGVTIHLVDRGVDTGGILYQARVVFSPGDNISTYQHVQAAVAIPLFAAAIEDALNGRLAPRSAEGLSRHWFPPTIWTYLANGVGRGVW